MAVDGAARGLWSGQILSSTQPAFLSLRWPRELMGLRAAAFLEEPGAICRWTSIFSISA